jgi:DNA-binding transcriptional ArsR family regulator
MDARQRILLGMIMVSVFLLLVVTVIFVYALYSSGEQVPALLEPIMQYHIHFMLLMALFGVFSGVLGYSMMNATIEKQKVIVKNNIELLMHFLAPEEQDVVELLRKKEGRTTQSEIARQPGMSRLKAHRIVKKLEKRGIVHVEREGKINLVRLVDELRGTVE